MITEDLGVWYDGAGPSAVGKKQEQEAADVREALTAGKFFRLTGEDGTGFAIGEAAAPKGDQKCALLVD